MKYKIIYIVIFMIFGTSVLSQTTIDNVLIQIEENNTKLAALRSGLDAEKIGNNTGRYLQNPEVEFHYLWNTLPEISNRTDITIKQGFDFPTAYKYRNNITELKNQQLDVQYRKETRDLLLEARFVCLDLVYFRALKNEFLQRLSYASDIADSYKKKYENGESNIIEYNKVQLALLKIENNVERSGIELDAHMEKLVGYNGGKKIVFNQDEFFNLIIPSDFDLWYSVAEQSNPVLNWIKQEIEVNKVQEKYSRALTLPKIEAGYMSEGLVDERFQGIIVGLSIPLWENKNTVAYAKSNTIAYEDLEFDKKTQFYNQLKMLHSKAIKLQNNVKIFQESMALFNSSELLTKALNSGEISLIEYIYEFASYYESIDTLLEMQLELHRTNAELNQYM